jgi:hypothetical protein
MSRKRSPARTTLAALGIIAMLAAVATSARAQIIHGQNPELSQRLTYMSWKVSGDEEFTLQEWHVPLTIRSGLAENIELAVTGAVVSASADWPSAGDPISGLTDAKAQVAASLMGDQVLLAGGVSLPTGQKKLSRDQQELLSWLSSDFLNFPLKNPGEGINLFGQAGLALPAGQWVFGASAALYLAGKYEPYDNGREYQPGSRLVGGVGAERIWPANHRLTCDLLVIYSTNDKLDGEAVFRDGVQFDARLAGVVALGRGSLEGGLRYIQRGKDKQPGPAEDLIAETDKRHGDDFRLHAAGRMPVGQTVSGWLSVDAKFLAANDYPKASPFFEDAAHLAGFGGGLDFELGLRARAGLGARVWTGSSDGAQGLGAIDLSGLEVLQHFVVTF